MHSRKNEGTFPPSLCSSGALTLGAGASEVGVSWVLLSRRGGRGGRGAQQGAGASLGIPTLLNTLRGASG